MQANEQTNEATRRMDSRSILTGILLTLLFAVFIKPEITNTFTFFGIYHYSEKADFLILVVAFLVAFALLVRHLVAERQFDLFLMFTFLLVAIIAIASAMFPGEGSIGILSRDQQVQGTALFGCVIDCMPIVGTIALIATFSRTNAKLVIYSFFIASTTYLILNLVSILFILIENPSPQYSQFSHLFYGHRNQTFRLAIPSYTCALLIATQKEKKWVFLPVLVYVIGLYEATIAFSATSFCALIAMGVVSLIGLFKRGRKYFNIALYGVVYIVAFFSLVILRVQQFFGFLIEPILHKTVTFSGRTLLWDQTFTLLQNARLLIGYGYNYPWHYLLENSRPIKHAHNEILNTLMFGGIFALVCLVMLIVLAGKRLYKYKAQTSSVALTVGLVGFLTASLAESVFYPGFFFILATSYYLLPQLCKNQTWTS